MNSVMTLFIKTPLTFINSKIWWALVPAGNYGHKPPLPSVVLAKKQIPGVEDVVRITYNSSYGLFKYHDKTFNEEETYFTDASLFSIFDFTIILGEKTTPFPDNNSIVITKSTAEKYFGNENPIGKIIVADDSINFQVTGVIKDFPKNSSIQGSYVLSL
jgi:putative ABC transport system permease protein